MAAANHSGSAPIAGDRDPVMDALARLGTAVIHADAAGRVRRLNGLAERLTGWTEAEAADRPLAEVFRFVDETARQPLEDAAVRVLQEGVPAQEVRRGMLVARDGSERPIDESSALLVDASGTPAGVAVAFQDLTERRSAGEAQSRLAAIVESSQDAIVSKTLEGVILTWNAGAERLFGYTAQEAIGRPVTILIPAERLTEEASILAQIARGERVEHYETVRVAKDGRRLHISLTVSPVRDAEGRIVGASKVARDVSDRRAAEEALKEADRRKDEFLALLAHELRNPLAPLRNGIEVLRMATADPQLLAATRDMMDRQLSHMVRLIDDLLDVSRLSRNRMELRRSRVSLADVVSSAVETARPAITAAGHTLSIVLPPEPVLLDADLTRLAQVFGNLLNNSAKYTPGGGRIQLAAVRRGDWVEVAVADNGIGIPESALGNIFEMFSQVDRSIERSAGGLGIGLALVRGLVEMHGGTVEAASPGEGAGSTVTVRLPILRSGALPQPSPAAAGMGDLAAEANARAGARRRILVADDNEDAAGSLITMLQLLGNDVRGATDGVEAVEMAAQLRPHLILMDIGMPRMNGYEATRRIREQPWGRDITILALTGWGQDSDRARSREAGCDGHLVKPVELASLERLLEALAESKS
jgi:PAS domain S-box-containing protein